MTQFVRFLAYARTVIFFVSGQWKSLGDDTSGSQCIPFWVEPRACVSVNTNVVHYYYCVAVDAHAPWFQKSERAS